jgi:hypothetical protein
MAGKFREITIVVGLILAAGCNEPVGPRSAGSGGGSLGVTQIGLGNAGGPSDPEQVRAADVSILFVGNSHTQLHDLPGLVGEMIQFREPGKTVYTYYVPAASLQVAVDNPRCREEIEARSWKFVVLRGQMTSASGRKDYSRKEAITLAKRAKDQGATVIFYPEWGLKGVAGDGARQQRIYGEMASEAGVAVAPVARAWDLAFAESPGLTLHSDDGNHQSRRGAFLTACVLYSRVTGESPATLASYPDEEVPEADRKFLIGVAAKAISEGTAGKKAP